jgi:hypothetical protein
MRKFFTLSLILLFVSGIFAQKPVGVIKKIEGDMVAPLIDGEVDDVWENANVYNIDKNFQSELPTLPTLNPQTETVWKALYDADGIYILLDVKDDAYYPSWREGGNSYELDKPELYFDVNYILEDGGGCTSNPNGSGHFQVDVAMSEANYLGGEQTQADWGVKYAFKVDDPNYVAEYFVPFSWLKNADGGPIDITQDVGFDVTIIDRDPGDAARKRSVWANIGGINESWANMDECGIINFEGAEPPVFVESIEISVDGDITEDNQPLQINAIVLPEDATDKTVIYKILEGSTARATISNGVITPITDGVLIVGATDGTQFVDWEANAITVNISGQKVTRFEVSYIKNGDFDVINEETLAPGAPWSGGSTVVDGVLNITNTNGQGVNPWDWTISQRLNIPQELKNDPFVLQLKMWISEADTFDVDIEHIGDDYTRFGLTPDPRSSNGQSQWRFELTTEPTWYTLEITDFSLMDDRPQGFNLFAGLTNNTVYIDSVSLVSVADLDLIWTSSEVNRLETFDVYPNPATDKLHVNLSTPNTKVVIYNNVGIMMEETVVSGTHHIFDVSRYSPGMYFVKAKNSVVKFIR